MESKELALDLKIMDWFWSQIVCCIIFLISLTRLSFHVSCGFWNTKNVQTYVNSYLKKSLKITFMVKCKRSKIHIKKHKMFLCVKSMNGGKLPLKQCSGDTLIDSLQACSSCSHCSPAMNITVCQALNDCSDHSTQWARWWWKTGRQTFILSVSSWLNFPGGGSWLVL